MPVAAEPAFADRLRALREAAGLTQYALAKQSGVSAQAIAHLERGERLPGWETVRKLARALGLSVAAFDVDDPAEILEAKPAGEAQPDGPELPEVAPELPPVARGKFK